MISLASDPQVRPKSWATLRDDKRARMQAAAHAGFSHLVPANDAERLLATVMRPHDRVCIEGNNQKHADFLAECLAAQDPETLHDLHIVQSNIALPQHLDIFEAGIARRLDFSYSGPQGLRMAQLIADDKIEIGAIHTYLELYARYFMDLTPRVSLIAVEAADRDGNLYTGANTEDTPPIAEATAFKNGILIAQANRIVDRLPRVDIPADWVDFTVHAPRPHYIEPIFTRDPAAISEIQILMAMMVIRGIYEPYGIQRLNHGIGFDTAAIELILPTYAAGLGLRGKICNYMSVNPCPTLIPAIESGFLTSIHSAGSEIGMEGYVAERPDIFFTGPDGSLRSNRAYCQLAGHFSDLFIGSTLQIDPQGNSSTATHERLTGFGGAPNFGCDSRARRHASPAYLQAAREETGASDPARGRKLVVQTVETFLEGGQPVFTERLDAWDIQHKFAMDLPPIMIHGEDVTHIVTEEGIANLLLCRGAREREQAIRGVAGYTDVGRARDRDMVARLRARGAVRYPTDLGIDPRQATRSLLAARSIRDLVEWSGGRYDPPARFRNW
ncbi:MAG: malonate decarboxylase subunit alpha [Qingshengfaniella sp.]